MKTSIKTLLAITLAVAITVCDGTMFTFAATEYNEVTDEGTQDMDVTIKMMSKFSVKIPKTIKASQLEIPYQVGVKGDIAVGDKVSVIPDSILELENEYVDDTVEADVTLTKTTWESRDVNADKEVYTYTDGAIEIEELSAGVWTGTINFYINLLEDGNYIMRTTDGNEDELILVGAEVPVDLETELIDELIADTIIADASEVDKLVQLKVTNFTGGAACTVDVSNVATNDEIVAIYGYDATLDTRTYMGIGTVVDGKVTTSLNSLTPTP